MTPNSSLLQWLTTFQIDNQPAVELKNEAFYNLADGFICAQILHQISPSYFTENWLEGIKKVAPDGSWRLRMSNLKRILQKIHDYASDIQNSQFRLSAITPDVAVIAQNFDPDQISRLIQLILFCAINCDKKQEYIERIHELPTQVKHDIKEAIEELLVKDVGNPKRSVASQQNNESVLSENGSSFMRITPGDAVSNQIRPANHLNISANDLSKGYDSSQGILDQVNLGEALDFEEIRQKLKLAVALKDEKAQSCHELELKLRQLQLEREQLISENERLQNAASSRLATQVENFVGSKVLKDEGSLNLVLVQNQRLQNEVYKLKEDLLKLEAEKEDYRLRCNLQKEDIDKITARFDDLRNKAELAKRLQDELDEQKHISEKVVSYETMMENWMKKNNEMRKEIKSLEEKNSIHIQTIVKLEQENQHLNDVLKQIEVYKKQLSDVRAKLTEETHRADKVEVELTHMTEKFEATRSENAKLYETTNKLMQSSTSKDIFEGDQTIEGELKSFTRPGHDVSEIQHSLLGPAIELKEKIARLEAENDLLRSRLNERTEAKRSILTALLEEATDKNKKLELENRQIRKSVVTLEANLKDFTNSQGSAGVQASTSGLVLDSSSDNATALVKRVEELQRALYVREQEFRDLDAKYKRNTQKAKEVIKALQENQSVSASMQASSMSSSSFNSNSLDETNLLRQHLRDREERLIALEREFLEFKQLKEVHERLILSAFYGLTTPAQWKNAERRLEASTLTSPSNPAGSSLNINSKRS